MPNQITGLLYYNLCVGVLISNLLTVFRRLFSIVSLLYKILPVKVPIGTFNQEKALHSP